MHRLTAKLAAALSASLLLAGWLVPVGAEEVAFLDIGQGDAILLQTGARQVLIDGGSGMKVLEQLAREMPWFDRTLEVVVSTHPDRDHLEGLLHVLTRYQVKLVVLPQVAHTSQLYGEWLTRLQQAGVRGETQYRFARPGQQVRSGELTVTVLGPTEAAVAATRPGKTNNASVITRVDMHGLSVLLTGDAEMSAEQELVQGATPAQLDVHVLKAGHHGSKTSTSTALLAAASPTVAVVSVGADNSYGHPHSTVLQRLANIPTWRTDQHGTVKFVHQGEQWLLKTQK